MLEINITVGCPDLVKAATILASAMGGIQINEPAITPTATPVAAQPPAPSVGQTASVMNPATANPTNGQSSMHSTPMNCPSSAAPINNVPLAQAPTYTLEQVSKAGADLVTVQPAKMQELMGLLAQFGVQTVNALRTDQLGAFATALRGMGAQI